MEAAQHLVHGAVSGSHRGVVGLGARLLEQSIELRQALASVDYGGVPAGAVVVASGQVHRPQDARQVSDGLAKLLGW